MVDYSKLSDAEISKMVAFALGCKEIAPDIFMSDERRYEFDKPKSKSGNKFYFDPCNNPADAWPIIVGNEISLISRCANGEWKAQLHLGKDDIFDSYASCWDINPLKAAMIVFLMMRDEKHG